MNHHTITKRTQNPYWILKAKDSSGRRKELQWDHFKIEQVIAIGWNDPDSPNTWERTAVKNFSAIAPNDTVLVCDGWSSPQLKPVRLYGIATNISPEYEETEHYPGQLWDNWRRKRKVDYFLLENHVSFKQLYKATGLARSSLTIQNIKSENQASFESFLSELKGQK